MTTVVVAATSAVVRAGLEAILRSVPSLEIVGSSNPARLREQVTLVQPDVVLIEVERDAHTPSRVLLALSPLAGIVPVVALVDDPDGDSMADAIRAGARAILPRQAEAEEIVAAVFATAAGLLVLHLDQAGTMLDTIAPPVRGAPTTLAEPLTPREIEVLALLAEGEGNKVIARRLDISEHTVKFHVGSILAKLDASSRTEAVTAGLRQGLIML